MKNNKLLSASLLLTALLLGGCTALDSSGNESIGSIPSSNVSTVDSVSDSVGEISNATNVSVSTSTSTSTSTSQQGDNWYIPTSYNLHNRDVNGSDGMLSMPHVGNRKILVVPVQLSNGTVYNSEMLTRLDNAFFGEASETSWHSVASFYKASSYGKLNITGEVTNVLVSKYSTTTLNGYGDNAPDYIAKEFYASASSSLLKEYDTDGDGIVDGICFIYSNNYSSTGSGAYWAWVYWLGNAASSTKPSIDVHMWASYTFMNDGYGTSGIDAHTYIHEAGHMLGLDDYYPYDNNYNAAGQLDMMDNNILDHNVYSKMAMEWTYPYVVTGSTTITLNPFESTGECIIINDNWNGSALDEYIAIEFYTPTGINQKDSAAAYPGNNLKGYTIPGVKIYHIDSRAVKLTSSGAFSSYVDNITDAQYNTGHYAVGAANSNEWSETDTTAGTYKLVHLLEAGGSNTFKNNGKASNATLFTTGKSFTPSTTFFTKGTKFNDGSTIGYTISVTSVSNTQATIQITKI